MQIVSNFGDRQTSKQNTQARARREGDATREGATRVSRSFESRATPVFRLLFYFSPILETARILTTQNLIYSVFSVPGH